MSETPTVAAPTLAGDFPPPHVLHPGRGPIPCSLGISIPADLSPATTTHICDQMDIVMWSLLRPASFLALLGYRIVDFGIFNGAHGPSPSIPTCALDTMEVWFTQVSDWPGFAPPAPPNNVQVVLLINLQRIGSATGNDTQLAPILRILEIDNGSTWVLPFPAAVAKPFVEGLSYLAPLISAYLDLLLKDASEALCELVQPSEGVANPIRTGQMGLLSAFDYTAWGLPDDPRLSQPVMRLGQYVWNWFVTSRQHFSAFIYGEWGGTPPAHLVSDPGLTQLFTAPWTEPSLDMIWRQTGYTETIPDHCVHVFNQLTTGASLPPATPKRVTYSQFMWLLHEHGIVTLIGHRGLSPVYSFPLLQELENEGAALIDRELEHGLIQYLYFIRYTGADVYEDPAILAADIGGTIAATLFAVAAMYLLGPTLLVAAGAVEGTTALFCAEMVIGIGADQAAGAIKDTILQSRDQAALQGLINQNVGSILQEIRRVFTIREGALAEWEKLLHQYEDDLVQGTPEERDRLEDELRSTLTGFRSCVQFLDTAIIKLSDNETWNGEGPSNAEIPYTIELLKEWLKLRSFGLADTPVAGVTTYVWEDVRQRALDWSTRNNPLLFKEQVAFEWASWRLAVDTLMNSFNNASESDARHNTTRFSNLAIALYDGLTPDPNLAALDFAKFEAFIDLADDGVPGALAPRSNGYIPGRYLFVSNPTLRASLYLTTTGRNQLRSGNWKLTCTLSLGNPRAAHGNTCVVLGFDYTIEGVEVQSIGDSVFNPAPTYTTFHFYSPAVWPQM